MKEKFVTFKSCGRNIHGMLHLPEKGKKVPCVVMCHGFTGTRVESHRMFVKTARKLCSEGFAVLRFDFGGSGDSEGDFGDATVLTEIEDACNAIKFILKEKNVLRDKISLVGFSLGGCVAASIAYKPEAQELLIKSEYPCKSNIFAT